jgi:hypothetical protein
MSQLGHVLALFIILASFSSSSGSYQHQDPLYPPASKRAVHNKLKFETQSFGLTTRPIPFTSPKLVNVDDFRAKGDHEADDTEVPTQFLFIFFLFSAEFGFEFFFFFALFVCSHLAKLGGRLVILKIVFLWYLEIGPIFLSQLHSQALANLISH